MIRVEKVTGYWEIWPVGIGQTHAVYYAHSDPGGSLPSALVNLATVDAMPKIFDAVRHWAKLPPYSNAALRSASVSYPRLFR